ncbi:MAG: hypothetical protein A2Y28_04770 [Chlamydiae bacterium GWC2_50_10]|nr:MAG: hypothetical protein A2Z85_03390 [Chlamydiae bacterium GWA2_50_15]OGN54946.1 MAG: hypothetical protein A2Y28_04770 [Chlamydiae bacterium GWC2_50_10]OGN58307.1 MAG: hypothetical protein A3D18_04525 [Chlamydiae bacterium RIFCSPHIGHO2_02_FULL_49_29]OGN63994.1 MAG: hypothetical protein A3E26_04855 [Chlamydiae bacterium RIFCSPHIGHO2_12_FULL_49_32]OGN68547.1 MAG: hypothetical protein A3I15_06225 [Chlamydiae bacterium RIFCSPLOWO2_02_FULL_49_12]OGN74975.1 MAG: hypothetical protein A3G30_05180 
MDKVSSTAPSIGEILAEAFSQMGESQDSDNKMQQLHLQAYLNEIPKEALAQALASAQNFTQCKNEIDYLKSQTQDPVLCDWLVTEEAKLSAPNNLPSLQKAQFAVVQSDAERPVSVAQDDNKQISKDKQVQTLSDQSSGFADMLNSNIFL